MPTQRDTLTGHGKIVHHGSDLADVRYTIKRWTKSEDEPPPGGGPAAGRVVAIMARGNLAVTSGSPWLPVGEATLLILESRIGLTAYLEPIGGFGSGRYAVYFDMPAALVV